MTQYPVSGPSSKVGAAGIADRSIVPAQHWAGWSAVTRWSCLGSEHVQTTGHTSPCKDEQAESLTAGKDRHQVRIFWVHLDTETRGNGEPLEPDVAQAWVDAMNTKYPRLLHWAQPASSNFPESASPLAGGGA